MCIIAAKFANSSHPSEAELAEMWRRNPDGAGIAYPDVSGGITVIKGLMTLQAFLEAVKPLREIEGSFYLMHFRIATHGSRGPDMTHPFWVHEGKVALAHNGILPFHRVLGTDDKRSDTAGFVEDILSELPENWYEQKVWCHVVEEYMGSHNKLAVIEKRGIVLLNSTAWKEDPVTKVFYSNLSYQVPIPFVPQTGGNQAANFRHKHGNWNGKSEESGGTAKPDKKASTNDHKVLGHRCSSMVTGGLLTIEEAKAIMREVKAGDWMSYEGEEFLDFYLRITVIAKVEKPTLLWALSILGLATLYDMAHVPDIIDEAGVFSLLDAAENANATGPEALQAIQDAIDHKICDVIDADTDTRPINLWNQESAAIFQGKAIRIMLQDGQIRIGTCTFLGPDGLTYSRHDGGTGMVSWDAIDVITSRLTLHNPQFKDLSRHLGCMVSVGTLKPSTDFSGQLVALSPTEFRVKCDMGINITAKYDEVLSVTIDEDPPKYLENKG